MTYPINPEYLANLPSGIVRLYEWLEEYIIHAICERLNVGQANETALELIRQLQRGGFPLSQIEAQIKQVLGISQAELDALYDDAIAKNNEFYGEAYDKAGLVLEDVRTEQFIEDIEAIRRQTHGTMKNLTQSMGFGMRGMDGNIVVCNAQEAYQRILDKALIKAMSGTESYTEAIRGGIRELTDSGLVTVEWLNEDGGVYHRNRADVSVRRAVMTGAVQISAQYTEQAAEDLDTPYREVSAHSGARDKGTGWQNHKAWQGRVYSMRSGDKYPSIYAVCGLGEVDGLEGVNCRHIHFPFIDGVSERTYTDEELENIDKPPFKYQGREYSAYEATQKQREIERALRNIKRRLVGYKAAGDTDAYTAAAARFRALDKEYTAFSKAAGLREQRDRAQIEEFGWREAKEAWKALG